MPVRTPAKEKILQQLRENIFSGEYASDMPLREVDLAEQFGVSRTPVREALRQLESEGLVRSVPNVGSFVGRLSWEDASEIFAVRIVLEAFAAQLTAISISPELETMLQQTLDEQVQLTAERNVAAYVRSDEEFHALINNACGNRHLIRLIDSHNDKTKLLTLRGTSFNRKDGLETSLSEHRAIVDAMIERDAQQVGRLVHQHGVRFFSNVVRMQIPDLGLLVGDGGSTT